MIRFFDKMTDLYNNDNGDIKGGRNDDHENVIRNSETSQKFFGTGLLISSFASSPKPFGFVGIKYQKPRKSYP